MLLSDMDFEYDGRYYRAVRCDSDFKSCAACVLNREASDYCPNHSAHSSKEKRLLELGLERRCSRAREATGFNFYYDVGRRLRRVSYG